VGVLGPPLAIFLIIIGAGLALLAAAAGVMYAKT
jgi:hypothetical protein